jgi:PAS domain S-box-containing protein
LIDDPRSIPARFKERILSTSESGSFALQTYLPKLKGGMKTVLNASLITDMDGRTLAAIQTVQDPRACGSEAGLLSATGAASWEWSPFPAFEIDSGGRISVWTRACENLLGYAHAQAMGLNPMFLVAEAHRGAFREAVVEAIKQNQAGEMECQCIRKDGRVIETVVSLRPIPSEADGVSGCVVGIAEVTRLNDRTRAVEREAAEIRERLRRLSEEHDLLKANVASLVRQKKP